MLKNNFLLRFEIRRDLISKILNLLDYRFDSKLSAPLTHFLKM